MNKQQQAYIEGFVKRASEYGFSENEAVEILKRANAPAPVAAPAHVGARRAFAGIGGAMGGLQGGAVGAGLGALKGLIAPGEEMDPETKKMVQRGRLEAMLSSGAQGALIGGGIGGLAGGAHGLSVGNRLRAVGAGQQPLNIISNIMSSPKDQLMTLLSTYNNVSRNDLQSLREKMRASATPAAPVQ
jgi:hypothetical protein